MNDDRTIALIEELRNAPAESAYAEFKGNNTDPAMIGRTVSALANAARLGDKDFGYIIWGISNEDHRVVGTSFQPEAHPVQKHPFEFWLAQRLRPSIHLRFRNVAHSDGRLVLLEVPAASGSPVEFDGTAYIRIGSATPRLSDYPERQGALWDKLRPYIWEGSIASQFLSEDEVFEKLDISAYFSMTGQPQPSNAHSALDHLAEEAVLAGMWDLDGT